MVHEQHKTLKSKEIDTLRRQLSNLKVEHEHCEKQKIVEIEELTTQIADLNESHENELGKHQKLFQIGHDKMLSAMEDSRGEIIATRHRMTEEMEQKIEAERLRLNIEAEKSTNNLKLKHQKEIFEFLFKIRTYRGVRHKLKYPARGQRTHTNAKTKQKFKF